MWTELARAIEDRMHRPVTQIDVQRASPSKWAVRARLGHASQIELLLPALGESPTVTLDAALAAAVSVARPTSGARLSRTLRVLPGIYWT